jgi:threonine/homoserine/homoserine lactone efflux protein
MPEPHALTLFLLSSVIIVVTPGPAVLYIVARSIDQGRTAGIVSTLGVSAGAMFHVLAAAFGLSAILVSSALAFSVVKYLGAAYLIYLGIQKLLSSANPQTLLSVEPRALGRIFRDGMVVNILNPKTALFFFAFLPQFIDPARGSVATQFVLLGSVFVVIGVISDGLYALAAGSARHWLREAASFWKFERYLAGTVFIGLGVATALSGSGRK